MTGSGPRSGSSPPARCPRRSACPGCATRWPTSCAGCGPRRSCRTGRGGGGSWRPTSSPAPAGWRTTGGPGCSTPCRRAPPGSAAAACRSTGTNSQPGPVAGPGAELRARAQLHRLGHAGTSAPVCPRLPGVRRARRHRSTRASADGLARLIGRNRARVLRLLGEPRSTTQPPRADRAPRSARSAITCGSCWRRAPCCTGGPAARSGTGARPWATRSPPPAAETVGWARTVTARRGRAHRACLRRANLGALAGYDVTDLAVGPGTARTCACCVRQWPRAMPR